jgi:large subunit ribosomal protein L32
MALPKRRHSKERRDRRRTHDKLKNPSISKCSNCGGPVLAHHICPSCGYYKGRPVIVKKEKKKKAKRA